MSKSNTSQKVTWQLAALVTSLIYMAVMIHGYFNMFVITVGSVVVAFIVALFLSTLAWLLAKLTANNGGVRNSFALFVPLVIVSAAGIFNSMMLNTQGETIYREAIDEADTSFRVLEFESNRLLKNAEAESVINRVKNLETAFIQELRHPINCGQGPAAAQIFADMKEILPQLTLLSGNQDCRNIDRLIPLYQKQIRDGIDRHSAVIQGNSIYQARADIKAIADNSAGDRVRALSEIESGANLVIHVKPILEKMSRDYKTAVQIMKNNLTFEQSRQIKQDLDFDAARSIGDVAKFPKLVISRLNDMLMYVILVFAVCVDLFLVYVLRKTQEEDGSDHEDDAPMPKGVVGGLSQ